MMPESNYSMHGFKVFRILRIRDHCIKLVHDEVAIERPIHLYINGRHLTTFLATPYKLKELAYGHLASEGIIRDVKDIERLIIDEFKLRVRVPAFLMTRVKIYSLIKIRLTSCGQALEDYLRLLDSLSNYKVRSRAKFTIRQIFQAIKLLNEKSRIFRRTGGVHAALLMDSESNVIGFAEDVGRHNAVDKAIGESLLKGANFSNLMLACTGRLSSEMALKAIRLGIPVLISISAPTDISVSIARKTRLTLIGFVRGSRMNIYSAPERIIIHEKE